MASMQKRPWKWTWDMKMKYSMRLIQTHVTVDETNVLWLEAGYIGPIVSYSSRDCDLPGDIP